MPTVADASRLGELIERYARAFGGPIFPPHVTVCSQLAKAAPIAHELCATLPLSLTLGRVAFGGDYSHACYLQLEDSASVEALQARCAAALGGRVAPEYPPHLSLTYGTLSPEDRDQATSLLPPLPLLAEFDHLEIWNTTGAVSTWHTLTP